MINSNGKIFGKINILDMLIVLVVFGIAVIFFTRGDTGIGIGPIQTTTYTIRFYTPLTDQFVVNPINIGDPVVQHGTELFFGNVIHLEIGEGLEWHPNSYGTLVASRWGDRLEMEITAEIELPQGSLNNGLMIQGNRFAIGQSVTIRAGDTVHFLRISYLGEGGEN